MQKKTSHICPICIYLSLGFFFYKCLFQSNLSLVILQGNFEKKNSFIGQVVSYNNIMTLFRDDFRIRGYVYWPEALYNHKYDHA